MNTGAMIGKTAHGTHYVAAGSGPVVILIHGVGMDLHMWDAVAGQLAKTRRVLRYDMLGHGDSDKPAGPYRLADFAHQLSDLADDMRIDRFDLVGFSMGGLVAQALALAAPDRLGRLILMSTVYDRSPAESAAIVARSKAVLEGGYPDSIAAAIDRWFTPAFRLRSPEIVEAVRRRMLANDLPAYAAAYSVFATGDQELRDKVGQIAAPTLVATGAEDQRSTAVMARALAARIPQASCHIIAGQRHLPPLEVPHEVAALIDGFLFNSGERAGQPAYAS
jgi:3-oxoadipate enol-lactonase